MANNERRSDRRNNPSPSEEGETSIDASRKRGIKAIVELQREIERKLDDEDAYGQTLVRLRWQGGKITSVSVTSENEHK